MNKFNGIINVVCACGFGKRFMETELAAGIIVETSNESIKIS